MYRNKQKKQNLKDISDEDIEKISDDDVFSSNENSESENDSSIESVKNKKKGQQKVSKKNQKIIKQKQNQQKQKKPQLSAKKKVVNYSEIDDKEFQKLNFLPGQKYPTPNDVDSYLFQYILSNQEDGSKIFYQSLYQQNPKSEMAEKYCLQYGLLDIELAKKLVKKYQNLKKK